MRAALVGHVVLAAHHEGLDMLELVQQAGSLGSVTRTKQRPRLAKPKTLISASRLRTTSNIWSSLDTVESFRGLLWKQSVAWLSQKSEWRKIAVLPF